MEKLKVEHNPLYEIGKEYETTMRQLSADVTFISAIDRECGISYYYKINSATTALKLPKAVKALEVLYCLEKGRMVYEPTNSQQGANFALHIAKNGLKSISITKYQNEIAKTPYSYGLGLDMATSELITTDLLKTPHLLIGGASGSGKSVLLNNIISSLKLYHPFDNSALILIDTKQVEFAHWEKDLNSKDDLACKISYNFISARDVLNSLCIAMDERYATMKKQGLTMYKGTKWIVVIDEFADLMLTDKRTIEPYIVRIAQMGRACGIHLIIATQRPSVNVVTGLIKANIPDRIALKCASSTDSRVIIDKTGAETLNNVGEAIVTINNKVSKVQLFNK